MHSPHKLLCTDNCSGKACWQVDVPILVQGEGIKVPGSGITISKTVVRGIDSFGMLCSAHDIGWSAEADGVLIIMPDDAQPGNPCPDEAPQVTCKTV